VDTVWIEIFFVQGATQNFSIFIYVFVIKASELCSNTQIGSLIFNRSYASWLDFLYQAH